MRGKVAKQIRKRVMQMLSSHPEDLKRFKYYYREAKKAWTRTGGKG